MYVEVMNIIGGLVLCAGILGAVPAMGKHIERLGKFLGSFQTIIGIIAIIVAILYWNETPILQAAFGIIVGLILIAGILEAIPAMGKHLAKLAKWLGSFQTIIGIIALIIGILGLLNMI